MTISFIKLMLAIAFGIVIASYVPRLLAVVGIG